MGAFMPLIVGTTLPFATTLSGGRSIKQAQLSPAGYGFGTIAHRQLAVQALQIPLHGVFRQLEMRGQLAIAPTFSQCAQKIVLPLGQRWCIGLPRFAHSVSG